MAKRGPFLVIQDSSGRIQGYAEKTVQKEIRAKWGSSRYWRYCWY